MNMKFFNGVRAAMWVGAVALSLIVACAPDGADVSEGASALAASSIGTVTSFPLPTAFSFPNSVTTGPDGALWFLETGKVGRITTAGALSEFAAPVNQLAGSITTGPDGALWFTNPRGGEIVRMTTTGVVTRFPMPANTPRHIFDRPQVITMGPDGALWFTLQSFSLATLAPVAGRIDRITTAGVLTEFSLPGGGTRRTTPHPFGITTGPDGALWFADSQLGKIGRITTSGALTQFTVPSGAPSGIARGADGRLWFTAVFGLGGSVGAVTTAGVFTLFPITGGPDGLSVGAFLAVASDGALWTSDYDNTTGVGSLVRVTTAGAISTFARGTFTEIDGITAGPDGAMWFGASNNQSGASSVGRVVAR